MYDARRMALSAGFVSNPWIMLTAKRNKLGALNNDNKILFNLSLYPFCFKKLIDPRKKIY